MNEDEWILARDPTPMIRFLVERGTDERKLRLLACACCRQVWDLMPDPRSRRAVEVAERFADGAASPLELGRARALALEAAGPGERQVGWAAYWAANTKASGPLWNAFAAAGAALARQATTPAGWDARQDANNRDQVALVREVIGNPFRRPRPRPEWLAWNDGTIPAMARAIYEQRAFGDLPYLGDALEEAGCADLFWLDHCRDARTPHVPGCWLLDALREDA